MQYSCLVFRGTGGLRIDPDQAKANPLVGGYRNPKNALIKRAEFRSGRSPLHLRTGIWFALGAHESVHCGRKYPLIEDSIVLFGETGKLAQLDESSDGKPWTA
jgi:hypothetical protein